MYIKHVQCTLYSVYITHVCITRVHLHLFHHLNIWLCSMPMVVIHFSYKFKDKIKELKDIRCHICGEY